MTQLDSIIIDTAKFIKVSIIWLHGLGADGHDFEPIAEQLALPPELGVRFIFPHAPTRNVTINNGMLMRAWYDISQPNLGLAQDEIGIRESAELIKSLVNKELAQGRKVLLAGFSQGGVIALHAGLRLDKAIVGILALSTYLALPDKLKQEKHTRNLKTPVLLMHGTDDPVVPLELSLQSKRVLEEEHYTVTWKTYPMPHSIHPSQILDIRNWLLGLLNDHSKH